MTPYKKWLYKQAQPVSNEAKAYSEVAWNAALEAVRKELNEEFRLDMDTRADINRVINDLVEGK